MVNRKIIATLLITSTTLSFTACGKEKIDTVKEDSMEVIEETIEKDTTTDNFEADSSKTEEETQDSTKEEKKDETPAVVTTNNNNSTSDKKENKTTANNTNTSSNTQQQQNNNNNGKQETIAPQPTPTPPPNPQPQPTPETPTAPEKTYKVRGDLVNTVFNAVNNYTSNNLNKKLTLTGTYNTVGEQYIVSRIEQGENPTTVNVKYTYIETDSINMVTEMPEVIGDRYSGRNECSVVVVENGGIYYIVFVSKY